MRFTGCFETEHVEGKISCYRKPARRCGWDKEAVARMELKAMRARLWQLQIAARLTLAACAALALSQIASGEVLDKVKKEAGVNVPDKLILPNGYDSAKAYPAVLAFPGGPQTMSIVQRTVEKNWRPQAEQRGYIVVVPAAPDGELFFKGGARQGHASGNESAGWHVHPHARR